jgi:hypothetical protein
MCDDPSSFPVFRAAAARSDGWVEEKRLSNMAVRNINLALPMCRSVYWKKVVLGLMSPLALQATTGGGYLFFCRV